MNPDWQILKDLRTRFLNLPRGTDYWATPGLLESYDQTFAARIGWKWDFVISEVTARGWSPPPEAEILDWGCGTGIASRKMAAAFPSIKKIWFWDRSRAAVRFCGGKSPVPAELWTETPRQNTVVVLSHVINELSAFELKKLIEFLKANALAVFWIEPGTPEASRALIEVREKLRPKFKFIAPCPHSNQCGLFEKKMPDWCHQFAKVPNEAFTTSFWREFGENLKVDLRSLPLSYLVADTREEAADKIPKSQKLGRPRIYKGYAQVLICEESGVTEKKILKRDDPAAFKRL